MSFKTSVTPNYSEGRFSTPEEMTSRFPTVDFRKNKSIAGGINIITDGITSVTDDSDNSTMVVGSTGSKKTRNVVMPYVYSCALAGDSMIIHDPKGDINKNLHKKLTKLGYKILVLDYRNPENGDRYNPYEIPAKLYKAGKKNRAKEMFKHFSDTIFNDVRSEKDPYWHHTARSYNAGLATLLCELFPVEKVTINNVYNLHFQGEERFEMTTFMKKFFEDDQDNSIWKMLYPVVNAPHDTKASLHSVFSSCLGPFVQNDAITDQTSNSTFQATDLVEQKTALFIISRDEEGSVYNALITSIIDQLYELLTDHAEAHGGRLKRKVRFILDEFGNLAKLNEIERKISMSRARGITWLLICQSLEQLSVVYGQDIAPIILGNCNNLVYLYSPDITLLKRISDLCGTRTNEINGTVKSPLCSIELLRHLDKDSGECLMLIDRMHPFITHLPDISQYYDIEPSKKVFVSKRKTQLCKSINFKEIVLLKCRGKIRASISANDKRIQATTSNVKESRSGSDTPDLQSKPIITILDSVISSLKGDVVNE